MAESRDVRVVNNPDLSRYEIFLDGKLAGFSVYRLNPGRVLVRHTEISDEFEGHGLGGRLARGVLDDIRRQGLHVRPVCPFVKAYIAEHPEYQDLVA